MACFTNDPTDLGIDFNAATGKIVTLVVKALGKTPPPMTVAFASYGGVDITAGFSFPTLTGTHGLIVVLLCPVDGQIAGLFEQCPSAGERLLKRFRYKAANSRRVFVVEGV